MDIKFLKSDITAFSNEETYRDSSMYIGDVVEHTTSWLTINPYKGCSLKCAYCFRVKWGATDSPEMITNVEDAIEKLVNHADFIPNITPISINISSTDALLPIVKKSTFRAIELLESKKLRNPFGITTKLGFKEHEINILESLEYLRPIVFISLAFIPENIEPVPIKPRIRNLIMLSKTKIPTVLYFRPIVEGWNDTTEIINKILVIGKKYADVICIGSLRISPEIQKELENVGIDTSKLNNDFHLKNFHAGIEKKILEAYKNLDIQIPLFKHTSCAISNIIKIANYNLLFKNPTKNCLVTCPKDQQLLCKSTLISNE